MNQFNGQFGRWSLKASRFLMSLNRRRLILRGRLGKTYLDLPLSVALPIGLFVLFDSPVTLLILVALVFAFNVQTAVTP